MGVPVPPGANREQNLVNYLENRRYLVVLDGVWKDNWCNSIKKLPDNGNGSRIIFSTCRRDLASECSDDIYNLDLLAGNEAWKLFWKKAFRGSECPQHLKEISEDLLTRCGGLPLAIVALGSLLSTTGSTPAEFRRVNASLGSNMESNSKLGIIGSCCFLLFCKFHEDYSVTRGRLIRLWIAEGFVEEKRDKTLEEVADAYLNELINGCLVEANKRDFQGVVRSCRVNNLVPECLVSISDKESFCKEYVSRVCTLFMFGKENFTTSKFGKALERFKFYKLLLLQNLESLDLRQTFVSELPKTICKVHKLVHLAVDEINEDQGRVGAGVFSGIGQFAKELGNLTAMRKLGITELESMDEKDLCASIQKMKHLSCLHVTSRSKVEVLDLDYMSTPPSLLHRLSLEGKLRMSKKSSRLDGGLIEALQALPHLMELQLVDAFNRKVLEFRCNSFQELRKLEVEQSDHLHTMLVHEGAMPNLQKTREYHWMIDHIQVIHTSCSPVNRTYPRFRNLSSFARY
ncbi:hypothetical protein PVL29_025940 [Vitis rotundifolia]|uniref:NB-ARC domain-containing protein n=1 Tax=Vitis rotundifolia TaxID=103349 RepID=A0AA38YLB4_VITRO|nr:hypothetical protein PVL29_025940 [Vitis rotundifolia]